MGPESKLSVPSTMSSYFKVQVIDGQVLWITTHELATVAKDPGILLATNDFPYPQLSKGPYIHWILTLRLEAQISLHSTLRPVIFEIQGRQWKMHPMTPDWTY